MEIERKFIVPHPPEDLEGYPHASIEQGYLCTRPVVRVRRDGEKFWLTYKGTGLLAREEYNLPLTEEGYRHLLDKADGNRIQKERYRIHWQGYTVELDVFRPPLEPLVLAEVEFPSEGEAMDFRPPPWFGREVTYDPAYTNASLSRRTPA
ncbi:MAG: CYTH domain-containing protein [Oscillospiraceae bacterium]|nr:CYTH domain-containing protein [Oscillospiraceae bacterium]